ncbi:arginase family protein [Sinomicrobium sp.]
MNHNINIVEFPSNLGLEEPAPGKEPGVKKLPSWLRENGFYDMLKPQNIYTAKAPAYSARRDPETGILNGTAIVNFAKQQAELLEEVLDEDPFPVIIGGDCSILVGNAMALKKKGDYGLFYLNGQTNYVVPPFSQSDGLAEQNLAVVSGQGHPKLSDIDGLSPYFKEEHIWCVGNRECEEEHLNTIQESDIHYMDLDTLQHRGTEHCTNAFLQMVEEKNLDGYFIHVDTDVMDDMVMPPALSRSDEGLTYAELNHIMEKLLTHDKAAGLEITLLDPNLDPTAEYTREFIANIGKCIIDANKHSMA